MLKELLIQTPLTRNLLYKSIKVHPSYGNLDLIFIKYVVYSFTVVLVDVTFHRFVALILPLSDHTVLDWLHVYKLYYGYKLVLPNCRLTENQCDSKHYLLLPLRICVQLQICRTYQETQQAGLAHAPDLGRWVRGGRQGRPGERICTPAGRGERSTRWRFTCTPQRLLGHTKSGRSAHASDSRSSGQHSHGGSECLVDLVICVVSHSFGW